MPRLINPLVACACVGFGIVCACATAQQPDIGGAEDTTAGVGANGGAGATGKGGSTASGGHGDSTGVSGSTSASGSTGAAGSTSNGGTTGSAGAGATAGSHSGGTSSAGSSSGGGGKGGNGAGGASSGGVSSGGTHAGGSTGTAGTSATAGGTSVAGTTNGGSTGTGGAASGTVLFSDDFEAGATDKWVASGGTWSIVTDGTKTYAQTATGTGSTVILSAAGSTSWTDQVVEARVKVTAFGGSSTSYYAAIYARFNGTDYYSLCLRSDGKFVIRKDQTSLSNAVDASIVAGTWYTVKFSVVGSTLSGYLNGTQLVTTTDSSRTSGGIAVSTVNTTAEFDDIKVTAP